MKKIVYLIAFIVVSALVFLNVFCTPFVPDPEVLLTVQVTGTGRITSVPAGIDSTSTTSCLFSPDTVVTLQARTTNGSNSFFSGWSGDGTGSFRDLTITLDAPKTIAADFKTQNWPCGNLVFVTSTVHPSSLGLVGFDAVCNTLATAAGINNATANGYRAWVSTSTANAFQRLVTTGGCTRLDGSVVFTEMKDAIDPSYGSMIFSPINIDEQGAVVASAEPVWTGTGADGSRVASATCSDWSGTGNGVVGNTHGGPGSWTNHALIPCSGVTARLYCMGVQWNTVVPITAPPASAKRIYLSTGTVQGNSVMSADCSSAGSGTKAVLVSTTATAASSYINPTTLYVTPSGVVVGTGAEILSGTMRTGIWERGDSSFGGGAEQVFTGSPSVSQVGTLASTCQDWTSGSGSAISGVDMLAPEWWNLQTRACNQPSRVYCVEQ
jgi:hypothetical protein